jgi:hypothetical protein
MRRLFRSDDEPGAAASESRARADDSGFRVVRIEIPARLLDKDPIALRIEVGGTTHRLLPADLDEAADFLVPAGLLGDGRVVLEAGDEELADPRTTPSPLAVTDAYTALHEELAAQSRRVEALRADLRAERDRHAGDEDDAGVEQSLLARERKRNLDLEQRLRDVENELDEVDDKRASLASQLAEAQAALREARG